MRGLLLALLALVLVPGCAEELPRGTDPGLPVATITVHFDRFLPNGTRWEPPFPGYHGCPDRFALDRGAKKLRLDDAWNETDVSQAQAVLLVDGRNPESFSNAYGTARLVLPGGLPHNETLTMSNVSPFNVTVSIASDGIRFGGATIAPGANVTQRFDYPWNRTGDGVRLNVTELVTVEDIGHWVDPIVRRPTTLCL